MFGGGVWCWVRFYLEGRSPFAVLRSLFAGLTLPLLLAPKSYSNSDLFGSKRERRSILSERRSRFTVRRLLGGIAHSVAWYPRARFVVFRVLIIIYFG